MLDILGDKGNRPVPVYNYEGNQNTAVPGNPDGTVTLHKLLNMMMHHRYWVISDQQYVHDIFSEQARTRIDGAVRVKGEVFLSFSKQ